VVKQKKNGDYQRECGKNAYAAGSGCVSRMNFPGIKGVKPPVFAGYFYDDWYKNEL
jgi:hypothetical protein